LSVTHHLRQHKYEILEDEQHLQISQRLATVSDIHNAHNI